MLCKWCLRVSANFVKLGIKYHQCNVFIFQNKRQTGYDISIDCKIKLFSGTILHGASNEPEVYLEPSETSMREHFCKNS